VALRAKVIDLVGLKLMQYRGQRAAVGQIGIVEIEPVAGLMEIAKNVIDAIGVKARRAAL
jgi:hypothetical protein